jgi:DNA mismatch endonuclease, patch repair protein
LVDKLSKKHRSWNMSRIISKDTKPEKVVRSVLHKAGYRFRIHCGNLPGKPDLIFPKYKLALFVHGCFWHRHENCKYCYTPKSRLEFWNKKFIKNVQRDEFVKRKLEEIGWHVFIIWECQTNDHNIILSNFQDYLKLKT